VSAIGAPGLRDGQRGRRRAGRLPERVVSTGAIGGFPGCGIGARRRSLAREGLSEPVEAVALAGDGDDQSSLLGVWLDLATQFADRHVDAAVERLETPVGEGVQQTVAADDPSWPADEHPQQSQLAPRQRDRLTGIAGEPASLENQDEAGEMQRWGRFR
jgi:hypothetical protein